MLNRTALALGPSPTPLLMNVRIGSKSSESTKAAPMWAAKKLKANLATVRLRLLSKVVRISTVSSLPGWGRGRGLALC